MPSNPMLAGSGTVAMSNVVLNVPAPLKVIVEVLVREAVAPVNGFKKLPEALELFPVSGPNEPIAPSAGITAPFAPVAVNVTLVPGVLEVDSEPEREQAGREVRVRGVGVLNCECTGTRTGCVKTFFILKLRRY